MNVTLRVMSALLCLVIVAGCAKRESEAGAPLDQPPATAAPVVSSAPSQGYQQRIENAGSEPGNWLLHGRTLDEQRFSPLKSVNENNVQQLGLAWYVDLPENRGQEATPIVIDGVMYTTAAWSEVFALDAATGKQLWHFDPEVDKSWGARACCDVVNRGAAVWQDKVYFGALDGRLIALDAKTGEQVWSVVTVDRNKSYTITGAPRIANGKVFIGNGGAEFGVRGYMSAYDAQTGKLLWRFHTVPGNPEDGFESPTMEKAAQTWKGEWWKLGGGGTVWDSMAYDPQLNLLYIGVGNGSPWNPKIRSEGEGDNLFLSSIVALNADTGEYAWHYQTTPGEGWDYTATQHLILADLELGGDTRKVIMQAPKNGFFYVLDRVTGEFISAEPFVPTTWASHVDPETGRPVVLPEAQYWKTGEVALVTPAWAGGHSWHPMSFSPETGLVYLPAQEMAFPYKHEDDMQVKLVGANLGVDTRVAEFPDDPNDLQALKDATRGHLAAWDPVAQKERWRVQHRSALNGGVLSTGGNLVFQGNGAGLLVAYRATDGADLWQFPAQTGVVAPPITYEVDGVQYVTVSAGWGGIISLMTGPVTWNAGEPINRSRLLTFALGGKAQLPEPQEVVRNMPDLSHISVDPAVGRRGFELYDAYCGPCHGASVVGGGVTPDLRYSAFLSSQDMWQKVVLEGILSSRGMVSFAEELDEDEADAIRQYVIERNQHAHSIGDTQRVSR
jgi:quinohemoprotein ethanol dehydrogenase